MRIALNKAYPRLISTKSCVRINSIPAQEAHQEASKASKVLTKSNHFIRHFELFCYYSPKKRKKTPSKSLQRTIWKSNLEETTPLPQSQGSAQGFCTHKEKHITVKILCFGRDLSWTHNSCYAGSISSLSPVSWMELMEEGLFVILAPDRFNFKKCKISLSLSLDLPSSSVCPVLLDILFPGHTNQSQSWHEIPFWDSQIWWPGTLFPPACPYHSFNLN